MRDFTIKTYIKLLEAFKEAGYSFQTVEEFATQPNEKVVVMRHDVDRAPLNSLKFAEIEASLNIKATYYFRMVKKVYDEKIIKKIYGMGHEIGYHYETMDTCKGDVEKAYSLFTSNLREIRRVVPVKTICMHGSPLSKYDNRTLWKEYDYKELGIIAEPYFDIDYQKVLYITDTGRGWNNTDVSIRDKVEESVSINVKTTFELIAAIRKDKLTQQIIVNTHPQRWDDCLLAWMKELVLQNVKNVIKRGMVIHADSHR